MAVMGRPFSYLWRRFREVLRSPVDLKRVKLRDDVEIPVVVKQQALTLNRDSGNHTINAFSRSLALTATGLIQFRRMPVGRQALRRKERVIRYNSFDR